MTKQSSISLFVEDCFVINDRYGIVGAQPYEVFKRALGEILK